MTTALDLITDVFLKMKVYAPGQQINAADSAWGLTSLNDMLDSWSNESLACFANLEQSFTLVNGINSYPIGPTAGYLSTTTFIGNVGSGGTPGTYALTLTGGGGTGATGTYTIGAGGTLSSINITAGGQSYTSVPAFSFPLGGIVGATATGQIIGIAAPRPISILTGQGAAYLVDTNSNRYPINVIEQDQWNQIGLLTETSQLPDTMFYNPQFPLGVINIFPTPSIAYTVYFDSRLQLADMANLFQAFSLPPGYMMAIKDGLFLRMWNDYKQGDPPAYRVEMASKSLSALKRNNIKVSPSTYDTAVVSKAQSSYNIYSDSTNRGGG